MSVATHYATLGLTQDATPQNIKASYKALALKYHPDKTLHLRAAERAGYAAKFRAVQEAYDILKNPTQKALYDRELERYANKVNSQYSIFHTNKSDTRTPTQSSTEDPGPRPHPFRNVRLTTDAMKISMKVKLDQQLWQLKEERAKRDEEDATMDIVGLAYSLKIWRDMANESDLDAMSRAHCQIRVFEYEAKLEVRKAEMKRWPDEEWGPSAPKDASTSYQCLHTAKTESRKRGKEERAQEEARRAESRLAEKARREATKKAHQEAKATAVRAQKECQQQKKDEAAAKEAERISRARAKVLADAEANLDTNQSTQTGEGATTDAPKRSINLRRICDKCGERHASLREWKRCSMMTSNQESDDASFFNGT